MQFYRKLLCLNCAISLNFCCSMITSVLYNIQDTKLVFLQISVTVRAIPHTLSALINFIVLFLHYSKAIFMVLSQL